MVVEWHQESVNCLRDCREIVVSSAYGTVAGPDRTRATSGRDGLTGSSPVCMKCRTAQISLSSRGVFGLDWTAAVDGIFLVVKRVTVQSSPPLS